MLLRYLAVALFVIACPLHSCTSADDAVGPAATTPLLPPAAKSRQSWETEKQTGYEVQLDVFPDVLFYGVLLLPKNLKPVEKRPVSVFQRGLEGQPTGTFVDDHRAYHDAAAML